MKRSKLFSSSFTYSNEEEKKPCDAKGCKSYGNFKAPKDKSLSQYYNFCQKHIKEYNKNWNFYEGMTPEEIEESINEDKTGKAKQSFGIKNMKKLLENESDPLNFFAQLRKNKIVQANNTLIKLSDEEEKSLKFFKLNFPFNLPDLKKKFKELAKKYHPDANQQNKEFEKKFKLVVSHYETLQKLIKRI